MSVLGNTPRNTTHRTIAKNEGEYQVLQKFSELVLDLNQDEETLLRFLRAREQNIANAEDMIRKSIKWREENGIKDYLMWEPPTFLDHDFKIKYLFSGKDKEGRPVLWIPIGSFLCKECIENGNKEILYKFLYHLLESGLQSIRESGKDQITAVLALENLSFRQILHVETMQTLYQSFQILEQNYPEVLRHLIVVNAPWMFSIAYNFVKPVLSEHTISKIQVYDSDSKKWIQHLSEIIPLESIPEEYLLTAADSV